MTKLSQLIERNRRHSESPYILLLEAVLPSGVTLRKPLAFLKGLAKRFR